MSFIKYLINLINIFPSMELNKETRVKHPESRNREMKENREKNSTGKRENRSRDQKAIKK